MPRLLVVISVGRKRNESDDARYITAHITSHTTVHLDRLGPAAELGRAGLARLIK